MIRSSWIWSGMFVWGVENRDVCLRCRKPLLWPVVGLTLGNRFNEIVYLDLMEHRHNHYWILHLIDTSTRYSAARLIKSKRSKEIIHNIFLMWISYFGCPKRFFSDNGGEFNNEWKTEYWNMHHDSNWSNGKDIRGWEMWARNSTG